jgi:nucleoid DNA-binding protein
MGDTEYDGLPEEIRRQIDLMAEAPETKGREGLRSLLAANWNAKFELFTDQARLLGMEDVESLAAGDGRGIIALTYSGSLLSMGPDQGGERWLEYASIKFRTDVPEIVSGKGAALSGQPERDKPLAFSKGPIKATSQVYRIVACAKGLEPPEQDRRIREAAIFITNGFMKLNRGLSQIQEPGADQFTLGGMARYVAGKNGLSITQTKQILDDFFSTAESGLLLGERVSMGKLGHLSLKVLAARKARVMKNPQTQAEILVPAKPSTAAPRMVFSSSLKEKSSCVDVSILGTAEDAEDED